MELDPLTFAAQILNFLLLLWFLKRFLFDRVGRVMEERAERAGAALAEAEAARRRAEEAEAAALVRGKALEAEREAFLAEARLEAAEGLRAALEEARAAGEAERAAWKRELGERRELFLGNLREGAGAWLGELSRRALADLAGEELEASILAAFRERLRGLPAEGLAAFREAALAEGGALRVEAGREPSPAAEEALRVELSRALGLEVRFEEKLLRPERPGLALEAGSLRLSWDFEDYVRAFEDRLSRSYDEALRGAFRG